MILVVVFGLSATAAYAATVSTDSYGSQSLDYSYSNSITTSSCSNPARGAGFYGIIYKVSSNSTARLYMTSGTLGDAYIQVLQSDRRTVTVQDDDAGSGYDSYLHNVSISTDQFVVATTFGQGATGSFNFYSSVPLTQVTSCPQVISTSVASSVAYGSTINMTASTNMGLTVSVTSQTPSVCSVTSAAPNFTIRGLAVGTCTLESTQGGNGSVEAASPVTNNVTVGKANLSLSGLTGNKDYDGTTAVTLSGTPGLTGVQGSDVVSVTGTPTGVFNTANAGTNTITVSGLTLSGANASSYQLVNTISGVINKINPTFTWSPTTSLYVANTGTTVAAAVTTGGGVVTYAVTSAGTTGCTISGRVLSFTAAGSCTVRATSPATTNYNVAYLDSTFVISKQEQSITWAPNTSLLALPNSTTMASATTSGNGTISYSVVNAGSTGCSVSGTTLNYTSAGTCRVKATASSTSTFNLAEVELDFVISLMPQTISVDAAESFIFGSALTITSSSNRDLEVSVAAQSASVCSVNSDNAPSFVITALSAGTCTLVSSQPGNDSVSAAGSVTTVIEILRKPIVITGLTASKAYDGERSAPLTGTAALAGVIDGDQVSLSGTPVGTFDDAAVGDRTVTISGLSLTGADAGNYLLDTQISGSVSKATPTLNWNPTRIFAPSQSGSELSEALALSGGSVSYSVEDAGTAGCSIAARVLSFSGQGACVLRATAAETANYLAVTRDISITVSRLNPVISWNQSLNLLATAASVELTSTNSGDGAVTYTVLNAGGSSCVVNGAILSFTSAGSCEVQASVAATTDFDAVSVSRTFTISRADQTLSWSPSTTTIDLNTGRLAPSPMPTASLGGEITFSLRPSTARCSVNQITGEVSFSSAGTCVIRATVAQTPVANSAYVDFTFTATAPVVLPALPEEPTLVVPVVSTEKPLVIPTEILDQLVSSSGGIAKVVINEAGLPELKPLQSIAIVDGKPVSVTLEPDSSGEALIASGAGFKVSLKAETKLDTSGKLTLTKGGVVVLSGSGFAPNTEVVIWLFSEPKRLGVITTDENGSFSGEVSVPSGIPVGEHTVQLNGETHDGKSRSVAVGVEVQTPKPVVEKSTNYVGTMLTVGAVLIVFAVFAFIRRRSRRS